MFKAMVLEAPAPVDGDPSARILEHCRMWGVTDLVVARTVAARPLT